MKKLGKTLVFIACIFMSMIFVRPDRLLAVSIDYATNDTMLDATYGFTPRFIPGITQAIPFGMTNYDEDNYQEVNGEITNIDREKCDTVRITSNSQKGNVGVRYNNVGTYKGQIVDLKLTLEDWNAVRPPGTYKGRPTYPTIIFHKKSIRAQPQAFAFKGLKWSFTFYQHGTNNPIKVSVHNTFQDMDGTEYMILNDGQGIKKVYLSNDTKLLTSDNKIYFPSSSTVTEWDKTNWTTILAETSYFNFTYGRQRDEDTNFSTKLGSRTFYWWIFTGEAVARFSTPIITEMVNGTSHITVHDDDVFNYEINTTIPQEGTGYHYSYFNVKDTVADCFSVETNKISVVNDAGQNVTSLFDVNVANQTVTFNLKNTADSSFYGKSYRFILPCKKKKGYDVSRWGNEIPNNSTITTDRGSVNSNIVYTSITHNIISSALNGTITESQYGIDATDSRTFSYVSMDSSKYVLENLVVDGESKDISKYPNSYTFSNINDDHTIEARYKRVYTIATSVKGGKITETQKHINKGESRTITYKPDNGYYLRSLKVDGKEVDIKKFPKSYTFSNITDDHTIDAEFLPKPTVVIKKNIKKDDIYFAHGTPTFIFKISGTDYLGEEQIYYATIQFTKEDIESGNYVKDGVYIQKNIALKDINAGTYEISEVDVSRYSLTNIKEVSGGVNEVNIAKITTDRQSASVTFVNDRIRYDLYTHNDLSLNRFNE